MTTGKTHKVTLLNCSRFTKKRRPNFDSQTHLDLFHWQGTHTLNFIGIKGCVLISFYFKLFIYHKQ